MGNVLLYMKVDFFGSIVLTVSIVRIYDGKLQEGKNKFTLFFMIIDPFICKDKEILLI